MYRKSWSARNNAQGITPFRKMSELARQVWVIFLSFMLEFQPVFLHADDLVVDDTNTNLSRASNGVPIVDIATPSAGGVSHNRFTQYNVNENGIILNNSAANVSTELAGFIAGNRALVEGSEAAIILNEVTAANRSALNGATEIAGRSANFILANPYGITCNGCGFVNTPQVTLTTGVPELDSRGGINRFRVRDGSISVEGLGLNAQTVSRLNILARAIQVNAQIHAQNAFLVAGANVIDAGFDATTGVTAIEGVGDIPSFGFDSTLLGGMYTNQITLIGIEAGVGFRLAGDLYASAGSIEISADGSLSVARTDSSQDIALNSRSGGIDTQATVFADGQLSISAQTGVVLNSLVAASGAIDVAGANLTVAGEGSLLAGLVREGFLSQSSVLDVQLTQTLTNAGQIRAGGDLNINAATVINQITGEERGLIDSQGTSVFNAAALTNRGDIEAAGSATFNVAQLDNNSDALVAGSEIRINNPGIQVISNNAGLIQAGTTLTAATHALSNVSGRILAVGEGPSSIVASTSIDNTRGSIRTNADVLTIQGQTINNALGLIEQAGDTQLNLTASTLTNTQGRLLSGATLDLNLHNADNSEGQIRGANLDYDGANLTNNGGVVEAHTIDLDLSGDLINGAAAGRAGLISAPNVAVNGLSINVAGTFDNSSGVTQTNAQSGQITAGNLLNVAGDITHAGAGLLSIDTAQLNNSSEGAISSNGAVEITASNLNNDAGLIASLGALDIQVSGAASARSGHIETEQALQLSAQSLDATAGNILSLGTQDTHVEVKGALDISGGSLETNAANLTLSALALTNNAGRIAHAGEGTFLLTTDSLTNTNGATTVSNGLLDLNAGNTNNTLGLISANEIDLDGEGFINDGGVLQAGQIDIRLTAELSNSTAASDAAASPSGGLITTHIEGADAAHSILDGSITLNANEVDNTGGSIASTSHLQIGANQIDNTQGLLSAPMVDVDAINLTNNGGVIQGSDIELTVTRDLRNGAVTVPAVEEGGEPTTLRGLISVLSDIGDAGSSVLASLKLSVSGVFDNSGSVVQTDAKDLNISGAGADATLSVGSIANVSGQILHLGDGELTINLADLDNSQGVLSTNGSLSLRGDDINNSDATLVANNIYVQGINLDNTGGVIQGQSVNILLTGDLTNGQSTTTNAAGVTTTTSGVVTAQVGEDSSAAAALVLNVNRLINNVGGYLQSSNDLNITTTDFANKGGFVLAIEQTDGSDADTTASYADANWNIAATTLNNTGGVIQKNNSGTLKLTGTTLSNIANGSIAAANTLDIEHANITNTLGSIAATHIDIEASSLTNNGGVIQGQGIDIVLSGDLTNAQQAVIDDAGVTTAQAGAITALVGEDSDVAAALILTVNKLINNAGGYLQSTDGLSITTDEFDNDGGYVLAIERADGMDADETGTLANANWILDATTLNNNSGIIQKNNDGTLVLAGEALTNTNEAAISVAGSLDIDSAQVTNTLSTLVGEVVDIDASTLSNNGGVIQGQTVLSTRVHGLNPQ